MYCATQCHIVTFHLTLQITVGPLDLTMLDDSWVIIENMRESSVRVPVEESTEDISDTDNGVSEEWTGQRWNKFIGDSRNDHECNRNIEGNSPEIGWTGDLWRKYV